jgi:ribonuclease BN (tRNA processing enzyme)
MKLTILGCAGTYPSAQSGCSSYLVEHEGYRLLVDAGNGAVGALQRHVGLFDVDAVVLSHLHADHCLDLVAYAYARVFDPSGCPPALPVLGPAGSEARLLRAFEPEADKLTSCYAFSDLEQGTYELGPFSLTTARVNHPVECYGLRLSADGHTLTYSADTGESDDLVRLAKGSDTFLCEASWLEGYDNPPGVHLTGRQAGEHAARADVGSLLLTHLVAWGSPERCLAESQERFTGSTTVVRAGDSYEI